MFGRSVFVHCPSCLGAAAAVLAAEVPCGDGVLTMWAGEHRHATHYLDRVMSHIFKCSRLSEQGSEPKLLRREFGLTRVAGERGDQLSVFILCRQGDGNGCNFRLL